MRPFARAIGALRQKYAGTPVTATEPVFDYMADASAFGCATAAFSLP